MDTVFRAAIVGTGRGGAFYEDDIDWQKDPLFYQGEYRHTGPFLSLPINHAAAYQSTPGYQLVAGANRTEEKLKRFGEKYGVKALYTDFRKMLREEKPDVVSVTTQSPQKAEVTIVAAEAGVKAIIVEKAMATSMAEADAMVEACERNGVFLAMHHPYRFSTIVREAKMHIDEGAIGQVGTVVAHWRAGMMHGGTHVFDIMRYFGGEVVELEARVPNYEPEKDLPATGMLWYANGTVGFFDHVHAVSGGWEVRGTKGLLTVSSHVGDNWLYKTSPFYPEGVRRKYPEKLTAEPILGKPHTQSQIQMVLSDLYKTLTTGAPFISTGRDGRAALELCLACYASQLAGGPVKLPLSDRSLRVPNR